MTQTHLVGTAGEDAWSVDTALPLEIPPKKSFCGDDHVLFSPSNTMTFCFHQILLGFDLAHLHIRMDHSFSDGRDYQDNELLASLPRL